MRRLGQGSSTPTEATLTLPTRAGRIDRRRLLTPHVLEVTIGGLEELASLGGDEFWFVLATKDGSPLPPDWSMADYRDRSDDNPIVGAYYTTRTARPETGELVVWVVMHGHPTGAAAQLRQRPIGTTIALWGPRRAFAPPVGASSVLLVADETGTAAVAALIESMPPTTQITAVLETIDAAHQLPLPEHPGLSVRWVHRGSDGAGGPDFRLLDAVRQACAEQRPQAAFGAAESHHVSAVRRYVRQELGLPAHAVVMTGYWRREP